MDNGSATNSDGTFQYTAGVDDDSPELGFETADGTATIQKLYVPGLYNDEWTFATTGYMVCQAAKHIVNGPIEYDTWPMTYTGPTLTPTITPTNTPTVTPTSTPTITPTPTATGANPLYVGNEKLRDDGVDTVGTDHVGRLYYSNDQPVATATPVYSYLIVQGKNGGPGSVIVSKGTGYVYFQMTATGNGYFFNEIGDYVFAANGDEDHNITFHYAGSDTMNLQGVGSYMTLIPDLGVVYVTGNVEPNTDNTYYLGKNDDDIPHAWKGLILKDTTNGKYYRIQVTNGTINAADLTD